MDVYGFASIGYEGELVRVEVDLRRGIPGMEIVGLAGSAVREARERIRIALRNAGYQFPAERILVNLSPADLPKSGSGFDLPMALAILLASGQIPNQAGSCLAIGELGLDGSVRAVPGVLPAAAKGKEEGITSFFVPEACFKEARCVRGVTIWGAETIASCVSGFQSKVPQTVAHSLDGIEKEAPFFDAVSGDFFPVRGQAHTVLALEVAAAGGHSLLFYGPPGSGKTLAAQSFPALLPALSEETALEATRIWSLAGMLPPGSSLLNRAPFRTPHHSSSSEGLLGGGKTIKPGEVSLAHRGVLFLDEAPEFSPRVLQSLREPLEDGWVSVVRAGRTCRFPAQFQLLLTANSCPCGQLGKEKGVCLCGPLEVRRYWDRIGNALLDRIDLKLFVTPTAPENLFQKPADRINHLRSRILAARDVQSARGQPEKSPNATLRNEELDRFCSLNPKQHRWISEICRREDWSSRAAHSLVRVSRTIADLNGREKIEDIDLSEAFQLRKPRGEELWRN